MTSIHPYLLSNVQVNLSFEIINCLAMVDAFTLIAVSIEVIWIFRVRLIIKSYTTLSINSSQLSYEARNVCIILNYHLKISSKTVSSIKNLLISNCIHLHYSKVNFRIKFIICGLFYKQMSTLVHGCFRTSIIKSRDYD